MRTGRHRADDHPRRTRRPHPGRLRHRPRHPHRPARYRRRQQRQTPGHRHTSPAAEQDLHQHPRTLVRPPRPPRQPLTTARQQRGARHGNRRLTRLRGARRQRRTPRARPVTRTWPHTCSPSASSRCRRAETPSTASSTRGPRGQDPFASRPARRKRLRRGRQQATSASPANSRLGHHPDHGYPRNRAGEPAGRKPGQRRQVTPPRRQIGRHQFHLFSMPRPASSVGPHPAGSLDRARGGGVRSAGAGT